MIPEQFVWLTWASLFLVPWSILYIVLPGHRRAMWWASIFTTPFGLTAPLFVPEYWNPPSLFNLASRTGFDIESLIFCFGIGGVGAVIYNVYAGQKLAPLAVAEQARRRHRFHGWAMAAPFLSFPILSLLPWNPIYPAIVAMGVGVVATTICRPDLIRKTWVGGLLFLAYYVVFLLGLDRYVLVGSLRTLHLAATGGKI